MIPPRKYPVRRIDGGQEDGHHCRCPICGHMVDEEDLEEVMQHIDPDHKAPAKN